VAICAIKYAIYLAILVAVIGAVSKGVAWIKETGYNEAMLEVAAANQEKEEEYAKKIKELEAAATEIPEPTTVTEVVEKVKYVTRTIEKEVFICDDLGPNFIRVRNDLRDCIFNSDDSGRDCVQ
jgi:hypothetical protein